MNRKQQAGFTLVEIAIVLVIIGLLLGGVLKGQELITNSKVKGVVNDYKGASAAIFGYQDRYRAIPGDDGNARSHVGTAATNCTGGNCNNGVINGNYNATAGESFLVWQHLRLGGFVSEGGIAATPRPHNSVGGQIGTTGTQNLLNRANVARIVMPNMDAKIAALVDTNMDNGYSNSGKMYIQAYNINGTTDYNAFTGALPNANPAVWEY